MVSCAPPDCATSRTWILRVDSAQTSREELVDRSVRHLVQGAFAVVDPPCVVSVALEMKAGAFFLRALGKMEWDQRCS